MIRSFLFVPADSLRKFERAATGEADALILDLEDSVAPDKKVESRGLARQMLAQGAGDKQLWVRMNALDTEWAQGDLAAVVSARPFGILLPKCRNGGDLKTVSDSLDVLEAAAGMPRGATQIIAIATELGSAMFGLGTYRGVSARLWGITWGAEDLAADLGALVNRVDGRVTEPYRLARTLCLYAAADAGARAIDTVSVDIENLEPVKIEAAEARRDGFMAKMAIHPAQVGAINAAFTPSEAELAWAKKIVAAFEANPNTGAFRLEGKMIDRPHLRAARRMLGLS